MYVKATEGLFFILAARAMPAMTGIMAPKMLSDATIDANIASIRTIFERMLTFGDGPTDAVMVNNYDWLGQLGWIELVMAEHDCEQKQHDADAPEELPVSFSHENADQRARDLAAEHQSRIHGRVGRHRENQQPRGASDVRADRDCADRQQYPEERIG